MTVVQLTKEQEAIAQAAMATGEFAGPHDVIDAALKLLQARNAQRAAFIQSLDDARREADETGYFEMDQVAAELDAIIAEEETRQAAARDR